PVVCYGPAASRDVPAYPTRRSADLRTTHGVNCTGSCSWKVFVKNGVITWENQQIDYPSCGPDMPEFEPRGCPRGASNYGISGPQDRKSTRLNSSHDSISYTVFSLTK